MNDKLQSSQETRPHRATRKSHGDIKAQRLQAALRENLRRRKLAVTTDPTQSTSMTSSAENSPAASLDSDNDTGNHEKASQIDAQKPRE